MATNQGFHQSIRLNDGGDVLLLPSLGTKDCDLQKFIRRGLDKLDSWSVIRINPNIFAVNSRWTHPIHWDSAKSRFPVPTCELCEIPLRKKANIPADVPTFTHHPSWAMILFNHKRREIFVCPECAAGEGFRDRILELIPQDWSGLLASDGRDVFGFVHAILTGSATDSRALIHTIRFRPHKDFMKAVTIDRMDRFHYGLEIGENKVCQNINWPIETLRMKDGYGVASSQARSENVGYPPSEESASRRDWSEDENRAVTAAYFDMLEMDLLGQRYGRAQANHGIQDQLTGRDHGSIEFKFQNISAILHEEGFPFVAGYRLAMNYQQSLRDPVLAAAEALNIVDLAKDIQPTENPVELEAQVMRLLPRRLVDAPSGQEQPATREVIQLAWVRDPLVKAMVLKQANGICELCEEPGPFELPQGMRFLEVHHVVPLAEGGPDMVSNAVAVCPNCHRRLHHSADRDEQRRRLYTSVERLTLESHTE